MKPLTLGIALLAGSLLVSCGLDLGGREVEAMRQALRASDQERNESIAALEKCKHEQAKLKTEIDKLREALEAHSKALGAE